MIVVQSVSRKPMYGSLQAGRAVAALLVVLYHTSKEFLAPQYWNTRIFSGFFDFGHSGVEFFFVLSGFIVAHVHASDVGLPGRFGYYLRSRLTRIYPVYWIVLAAMLALTFTGFNTRITLAGSTVVPAILLFGGEAYPTVLLVAWTLFHEIAFYAVFGLAILSPTIGVATAAVWLVGIVAASLGHAFLPGYLGQSINLLFALGVATWWLSTRRPTYFPITLAWLGAISFLVVGIEDVYRPTLSADARQLLFGLACAITIAALIAREQRRAIKVPPFVMLLGAASYSIYLVHQPFLAMLAKLHTIRIVGSLPNGLVFFFMFVLATMLGVAFHLWIERPVMRSLKPS